MIKKILYYYNVQVYHNWFVRPITNVNWFTKNQFWKFFYSGFYFDELYSLIFDLVFIKFFILPGFFFFDKYLSYWTNVNLFNYTLQSLNIFFYNENFDIFFFFYSLLLILSNLIVFYIAINYFL